MIKVKTDISAVKIFMKTFLVNFKLYHEEKLNTQQPIKFVYNDKC